MCERVQALDVGKRQKAGMTNEPVDRGQRSISQACWLLQTREVIHPKLTILLEPLGAAIPRIVFKQRRHGTKSRRLRGPADSQGRIDGRHSSGYEREAKPIHHDVVVARIPEETVRGCLEESIS